MDVPAPAKVDVAESVTNNQHAGVDEGDIVKLHGDHLVMLRRGRLFTVSIANGALTPVAAVDAFGPDIDPSKTWYDELLVEGDKVVVVGFSYQRGGTEISRFRIDSAGGLEYLDTYQLRSSDYYSARNYASRMVNGRLVFYAPTDLEYLGRNIGASLPALRRWKNGTGAGFERIAPANRIYRPVRPAGVDDELSLHTVTSCDLGTPHLECTATILLGPPGRVFYVSPTSVYVWVSPSSDYGGRRLSESARASMLYRMPLDGSAPTALAVSGTPMDQFSFLEDDKELHVLVRAESGGDAMWASHLARGSTALLQLPLAHLGNGTHSASADRYVPLPTPGKGEGDFQNRFVGRHLLYGVGNGWSERDTSSRGLFVVGLDDHEVATIDLPHPVDRIEVMGADAVVVGSSATDLLFSGIRLSRPAKVVQRFTLPGASQGELRSHGFFYKPEGSSSGVIGLPVRRASRPGYAHLVEGSASVVFLRNTGDRFDPLGDLAADPVEGGRVDTCRASCVDWYGNARPLFARGRVFALLGYELVEGVVRDGRIREVARVSYAPALARRAGQ